MMAKRGRPTIGAEPMTPAERQRRRRAKLVRTGPGRTGRPKYDFFGDPERFALAHCEAMIRQGKSERKALVIAVAATWSPAPDFIGPILPWLCLQSNGAGVMYVPPGSVRVRAKHRVNALRWKLEWARRNPIAASWLDAMATQFAILNAIPASESASKLKRLEQIVRVTAPELEEHFKRVHA
jgi:hypothetical protein